ncbi:MULTISPECIES: MetQ/NlpA family ABC transporter substrate-binding protein [Aerococcus]|uniref:Lipoprotein n=1 Tax=Aerococcus sanguinicola TaxID=119206 RepID=A0A5N1GKT4_9LACT|nr:MULTISPECIES: MetQ/NlpA family ABC transporter substrate-binding protein [Aerococcus]KAA9300631.1 methionine ABC transporter substrate-binding protein [Aerococcus sanguinicola]MDK6370127.1 MetQ/NlpA family ABC transporter substrate-binding protein [Aerococcus sp. UMB9870]MDK6680071.1 MetQ/NlpA family ABC transporter substrate-binding protein [Aerococcus sp. UMB8608]MDK6686232.1 MetQ/NlpA family ABC transporter substrate-binding protein [Aerococcus sp. UMB8623]MDK6939960.1 MetQ/NlpA family A
MKRFGKFLFVLIAILVLGACGKQEESASGDQAAKDKVRVAVVGSSEKEIWEFVADKAKAEGIDLEVTELTDYNQPNQALANGDVDINAFQHYAFLKQWNEDHNEDLTPIGLTFITPLYIFSDKVDDLKDLPEGGQVIIPQETSIQGRALLALQTAGVLKLRDGGSTLSQVSDVVENPKNIELVEVESAQAPRLVKDVDAAVVNGSFAEDAGMKIEDNIFTDADHLDQIPNDRYNLIVARKEDQNNPTLQKIVQLYQAQDVADKMNEVSPGQYYPVWGQKVDFIP